MLELRSQGREVSDEILSHVSPGHSDNINFFGVINVDVEAELAKLDTSGWRPLRAAKLRELGVIPERLSDARECRHGGHRRCIFCADRAASGA
ncbi:hypothetical protein ACQEVF_49970 [Nonomuraea polychroma]|uniref:hypothetical protein n=1 Tax=Nonomuraea polychroma TaxID=46176 RepID=UPI003D8BA540